VRREFSAGGVVVEDGKVLMIYVKRFSGEGVWTFPKGHIEKGESKEEAAIREVEEETGIKARIKRELGSFTYFFRDKDGEIVKKTVYWFLMEPVEKSQPKTPEEVLDVKWFDIPSAKKVASYESDKKIIQYLEELFSNSSSN